MFIDIDHLIAQVRARPAIWTIHHVNHSNRPVIDKIWFDISQQMKVPVSALRKKWKYLRDQFRAECRKIPADKLFDTLVTTEELKKYVMWPHFGALSFLKSQMKLRKVKSRYASTASLNELEDEEESTVEPMQQNDTQIVNIPDCDAVIDHADFEKMFVVHNVKTLNTVVPSPPVSNKDDSTNLEAFDRNLQLLEQQSKRFANKPEEDEDKAFFTSLLPHIRTLSPGRKMLCRIEMQNLVYKHVYQNKDAAIANSIEKQ